MDDTMNDTQPNYIVISKKNYDTDYDYEEAISNTVIVLVRNDYAVFVELDKTIDCAVIKYWEYVYTPVVENVKAANAD